MTIFDLAYPSAGDCWTVRDNGRFLSKAACDPSEVDYLERRGLPIPHWLVISARAEYLKDFGDPIGVPLERIEAEAELHGCVGILILDKKGRFHRFLD